MSIIAVVDTETSRHPRHRPNRVVEIAIILWDAESDSIITEIETLVNPNSVIEAESSKIHGLSSSDLEAAPSFDELSKWLPHYLEDRIVCGFNVSFDIGVLNHEFERSGNEFRLSQSFCARMQIPGNQNKTLEQVCTELGITNPKAHTALGDARATLQVLRTYGLDRVLESARGPRHFWSSRTDEIRPLTWSIFKAGLSRDFDLSTENAVWELEGLSKRSQYLGFISNLLEDRNISEEETIQRKRFAAELGLSDEEVEALHAEYVSILEERARENRVVSELEVERIGHMARLLGHETSLQADEPPSSSVPESGLICVTSTQFYAGREWSYTNLEIVIRRANLTPTNKLNKKDGVNLLLCPDINVRTGKGKKAAEWKIPLMTISDFLKEVEKRGVDLADL